MLCHELAESSFGVMQLSCVDHNLQILQLIMSSGRNHCIILDLNWSKENFGDNNLNSKYSCLPACTADIISLHQNEFHSGCLHVHTQTIDNFFIFITQCCQATAMCFCITLRRWQYFEIWNNLKGLDFSSLLTCRDLPNVYTNFHVTFSLRYIESLPLTYRD